MNSSQINCKVLTWRYALVIWFLCISLTFSVNAEEQTNETSNASKFDLNASIMEINLENNFIVVAEKKISLPYSTKNGEKEWHTLVITADGQSIHMTSLKRRYRVIVTGTESITQGMKAEQITLLDAEKSPIPSAEQQPSKIYQENGVWKN